MYSLNNYADKEINGQICTWLQSYGWAPTKKGSEVKPGDVLLYNFGHTYTVKAEEKQTKAFTFFTLIDDKTGKEYPGVKIGKNKNQAIK